MTDRPALTVLLAYPPATFGSQDRFICFLLDFLCLASFLKKQGFRVRMYQDHPFTAEGFLKSLKKNRPQAVVFSCDSANSQSCFKLCTLTKKTLKGVCVILVGNHATAFDNLILQRIPHIDVIARHEAEESLSELLDHLKNRTPRKGLQKIKGLTYKKGGRVFVNQNRPFIKDLDALPLLDYDLIDMDKAGSINFPGYWPIYSGRGCCFNCNFCNFIGQWGRTFRYVSPQRLARDIDHCIKKYGIRKFYFHELTFTANKTRVRQVCRLLKERKIRWGCLTRVDCVDKVLLDEMRQAGCDLILYGVDSFSDKMLKLMGKTYTATSAARTLRETRRAGIRTFFQLILGFPGETEKTLQDTVRNARALPRDIICNSVNIYQLHPGSPVFNTMKKLGMINDEALFKGFRMKDFIRIYYPAEFIKKIYRARDEIQAIAANAAMQASR